MTRSYLPLNSLRAFEAAARHLSFTRAAIELNVTHSAISQHVKPLEEHLNCQLFVRVSRGLKLTTEGEGLLPVLNESFERIAGMLDRFTGHQAQEKRGSRPSMSDWERSSCRRSPAGSSGRRSANCSKPTGSN